MSSPVIDASTRVLGVIGHPVAHSMSPAFWNPALAASGTNAVFLAFDVAPDDLAGFMGAMRAARAVGFNVTIPHKTAAFDLADRKSPEAERTGAVNVLKVDSDEVLGHNTDVEGVLKALEELGVPSGSRALLLGAGGAARAAALALSTRSDSFLIANRTASSASHLARAFGAEAVPWEERQEAASGVDLIVNATSIGLASDEVALETPGLGATHLLDLVYAPGETSLVRGARKAGLAACDGLHMLVFQAAAAWRFLLGSDAPLEVMMRAALEAAGRPPGAPELVPGAN